VEWECGRGNSHGGHGESVGQPRAVTSIHKVGSTVTDPQLHLIGKFSAPDRQPDPPIPRLQVPAPGAGSQVPAPASEPRYRLPLSLARRRDRCQVLLLRRAEAGPYHPAPEGSGSGHQLSGFTRPTSVHGPGFVIPERSLPAQVGLIAMEKKG